MSAELLIPKPRIPWGHFVVFGWMPSAVKCWCYRHVLGYQVGRGVRLGFGAVIVGKSVRIAEYVEIGMFTIVRGRQVSIGRHTQIGSTSYLMCETIDIGEDAKINEQVFVGGPMLPESLLRLGNRTIVMQMSFLNPTKPLVIGDDTGIGGHCLIFTHGSWLNILDGYPVTFEGVTLGESVWLPWRVFVMPGARIGNGTVIGANSLVQGVIPPSSLAVGTPAKVIRTEPEFPRRLTAEERDHLVETMLEEFRRYVRAAGIEVDPDGSYRRGAKRYQLLRVADETPSLAGVDRDCVVLAVRQLGENARGRLRAAGASWLDLAGRSRSRFGNPLCEELALFLARYGIRLKRDA